MDIQQEFKDAGMTLFKASTSGKGLVSATHGLSGMDREILFGAFEAARVQAVMIMEIAEKLENQKLGRVSR